MTEARQRAERRTVALSKAQIVRTAVEILDAAGVEGLTFRALGRRLSTGAGAIYHHVANKSDLLGAAADAVMTSVLTEAGGEGQGVRVVMMGAFDAISAHPWVGTQLAAAPWQPAVLELFERIGAELDALGVPEPAQFDATSVLMHQVLGVASQYDAGSRMPDADVGRAAFLESTASNLMRPEAARDYPFMARIAPQLAEHDDRAQFSAGVEIILAGITYFERPPRIRGEAGVMPTPTDAGR